jgi:anti-sigma-K factor RskA
MSDLDDIDALAAEYVVGTLDATERRAVAVRRMREPRLEAAIQAWELRLAPLDMPGAPVEPPTDLLARIETRLGSTDTQVAGVVPPEQITILHSRLRRWRAIGITASAAATVLVIAIGLRETILAPQAQSYVAVFQKDDALPAFLLTINLATRELTVRPVAAEPQPGKTYQLWIASDQLGPAPRPLGLLGDGGKPSKVRVVDYEPALLHRATFGVSLEPAGGSPTGQPTGPALHANLYPASP